MVERPIKIEKDAICFDVTGPESLVKFGWWLKDGGAGKIHDGGSLVNGLFGVVEPVGDFSSDMPYAYISLAVVCVFLFIKRNAPKIKMVRYASASGFGGAVGTARPRVREGSSD